MSVPFAIFSKTGALILAPFLTLTSASSTIATAMGPILIAGLTIQIMWHGYETMRGKGGPNAFLDIFSMSVRAGLVVAMGLVGYTTNVVGEINEVIGWLSTLFSTSGAMTGSGQAASLTPALTALDAACSNALGSMNTIWDIATGTGTAQGQPSHITLNLTSSAPADFSGVMMIFQGGVMLLAFAIYACIAAFELLYIQIALLIFYAIGPLFVAAYAFRATEHWFASWLKGAAQYAMTAVVIAMCIGVANSILTQYTTAISGNVAALDFVQLGVVSIASAIMLILLIKRVPELASHIVSGFAIQSAAFQVGGYLKQKMNEQQQANGANAKEQRVETRHQEMLKALGGSGNNNMANSISAGMASGLGGPGTGTVTGSAPRPTHPPSASMQNMIASGTGLTL